MNGVNAACSPSASQVQNVQAQQQGDVKEALNVMKDMVKGKVSAEDGMKQLQALVADAAKAQASLAPGAATASASASSTGFSSKDTFEAAPAAKPAVDLLGAAGGGVKPAAVDPSFLEESGGGAKRGIASGAN